MTTLGVVVPAYRPDAAILSQYVAALEGTLSPDVIRVELDDPGRRTAGTVERALADTPATVHVTPYRRGKGAAVTAGFEALDTDVLAFADADGSTTAESFADVVTRVRGGDADLAVGSRRHPDATVVGHQTVARRLLGDGFARIARRLLAADLHDYQCGAKAITSDGWEQVREHLYEAGFAWDIELVAMAASFDLRISEVPITWEDQPGSTVEPVRTALRMGRALLAARHRAKQLQDSRLHAAVEARRGDTSALVEQE